MGKKDKTVKTSQKQRVDEELVRRGDEQYQRALALMGLRTQPNRAPTIAAFTPMQEAAFQNTVNAARAFGLHSPRSGTAGMPAANAETVDGFRGSSGAPLFDAAVGLLPEDYTARENELYGMFAAELEKMMGGDEPAATPQASSSQGGGSSGGPGSNPLSLLFSGALGEDKASAAIDVLSGAFGGMPVNVRRA